MVFLAEEIRGELSISFSCPTEEVDKLVKLALDEVERLQVCFLLTQFGQDFDAMNTQKFL